jgi:predicted glutamine amidotransferase
MCQVLMLTNTFKIKNMKKTANVIAGVLQETQRDGFGYAVLGKQGVFGERSIRPKFESRLDMDTLQVHGPMVEPTYNQFGVVSQSLGGAIFHGRTSTNHKTLINTHPINLNNWSLIHNGVVTDLGPDYIKTTTNDTEDILHHLIHGGISAIEKNISGYYAVGAIDPKGNLHVIKDSTARLFVAMNKTLDCLVFGTTEELIQSVSKKLKWVIGPIEVVKNDTYMIFDKHGELKQCNSFKPLGYTVNESAWMGKSLGYDDTEYSYPNKEVLRLTDTAEESIEAYREEIDHLDVSYTFKDWLGRSLSLEEFRNLDEVTKMDCLVIRADGTIVDALDYYTDKIA